MRRREFAGLGAVYRFTLIQQLKNRANRISLVILLTMSLLSLPLASLTGGGLHPGAELLETGLPTEIYLDNRSPLRIRPETAGTDYAGIPVTEGTAEDLAPTAAQLTLLREESGYRIQAVGGEELDAAALEALTTLAQSWLQAARMEAAGISAGAAETLSAVVQTGYVGSVADYAPQTEDALGFDLRFGVSLVYSIVVMILCTYAATYIVRIIVEEKSSRLVELLMVSVQPLALVLGKILAMMTYIFGMVLAMAACFGLSGLLNRALGGAASVGEWDLSLLRLDAGTVVLVLVSLLLAYAGFALLAGLAGTCCSRNEDVDAATGTVMALVMAGYLVSCAAGGVSAGPLSLVVTLCPVINVFCAPAQYITGNIGLVWLLVSWLEQAAIVAGLAWLTARVYRQLLLSRGSRIRLRQLLSMARQPQTESQEVQR